MVWPSRTGTLGPRAFRRNTFHAANCIWTTGSVCLRSWWWSRHRRPLQEVGDTGERRYDWIALLFYLPVQPKDLNGVCVQVLDANPQPDSSFFIRFFPNQSCSAPNWNRQKSSRPFGRFLFPIVAFPRHEISRKSIKAPRYRGRFRLQSQIQALFDQKRVESKTLLRWKSTCSLIRLSGLCI